MNTATLTGILIILMVKTLTTGCLKSEADLTIAGLFEVYNNEEGHCKELLPSSVQILEAVKWSVEQLNKYEFVPGIKFGLEAFPTCGLATNASKTLIEILSCNNRHFNKSCSNKHSHVFGVIGPSYSKEVKATATILGSLPIEDRIPQIGFSATASEMTDIKQYPNFLSVIASDQIQVNVMVKLMKTLGWTYVAVLYENDIYGIQGAKQLSLRAKENDICIVTKNAIGGHQNDKVSTENIRSILEGLLYHRIRGAVFFGSSPLANKILSAAKQMRVIEKITFIFSEGIELKESTFKTNGGDIIKESVGSFTVSPPVINVDPFSQYWTNLFQNISELKQASKTNRYLLDVFEMFGGCRPTEFNDCSPLNSTTISKQEHSVYLGYAIRATLTLGLVFRNAYLHICGFDNHGNCSRFKDTLIHNKEALFFSLLKNSSLTSLVKDPSRRKRSESTILNALSTLTNTVYDVYQFTHCPKKKSNYCLVNIGYLANDVLNMNKSVCLPTVRANCPAGGLCSQCIEKEFYDKIYFEEGDLYVVGVVPACHKDQSDPMGCAGIKTTHSVEMAEVMAFAVTELNKKSYFFGNKKIGFIILNSCNQRLVIQRKILDLLETGLLVANNSIIDVRDKILGFVGGFSSTVTIAMFDVLSRLNYVQVAYASTARCLNDRVTRKNFLRVVPSVSKEVKAIIDILRKLNGSDYIQIVYSEGAYGDSFRNEFKNEAKSKNICIANEIQVYEGKYSSIIDTLRKNPYAKIVLSFLQSYMALGLSNEIKQSMDVGEFMFIGTVAWGDDKNIIDNNRKLIGSLKLSMKMKDIYGFNDYIRKIDLKTYKKNPWYKEYVQEKYNCYLEGSFDKTSNIPCRIDDFPERSLSYKQEQWTSYAYIAMVAFLKGANQTFYKLCGGNSDSLCEEYRQSPNVVANDIRYVELDLYGEGKPELVFDGNGDGSVPYQIYNVKRSLDDPKNVDYFKVGESKCDENGGVALDVSKVTLPLGFQLPTTCPNDVRCTECFGYRIKTSESDQTFVFKIYVFLPIIAAVIIIVILNVLVRCCLEKLRNRQKKPEKENNEIKQDIIAIRDHYDLIDTSSIQEEVFTHENDKTFDSYLTTCTNVKVNVTQAQLEHSNHGNEKKKPIKITFTNMGTV